MVRMPCSDGFPETFLGWYGCPLPSPTQLLQGLQFAFGSGMQTRDNYTRKACSLGICSSHLALPATRAPGTSDFISLSFSLLDCERRTLASGVRNVNDGTWSSPGHSWVGPGALMAITGAVSHSLSPNLRQQFRKCN